MTPYAVLLVKPSDSDDTIRAAFHRLSKEHHPDRAPGAEVTSRWYDLTAAYAQVKTQALRDRFEERGKARSGVCAACRGVGVRGSRMAGGKIRVCDVCGGEGRKAK